MHLKLLQKSDLEYRRSNWWLMAATGNKNADKIKKVLRTLTKNDLGTVTNDTENIGLNREITKNTYMQHIIDDLIMEHKKK